MSILILKNDTFPAWRHNALGESKIVQSADECKALGLNGRIAPQYGKRASSRPPCRKISPSPAPSRAPSPK